MPRLGYPLEMRRNHTYIIILSIVKRFYVFFGSFSFGVGNGGEEAASTLLIV